MATYKHYLIEIIVGIAIAALSYYWGYDSGKEAGIHAAYAAAIDEAKKKVTDELVEQRVQDRYGRDLSEREAASERKGYASGQNSCALERFYSIFSMRIRDGAGAAKESNVKRAVEIAQNLIYTRATGRQALGEMANDVMDGLVDRLEDALRRNDNSEVIQIMKELGETIEPRDIKARRAMEALRNPK
jgi:hypothetical protein